MTPGKTLLVATFAVALSTAALSTTSGYGTLLFLYVVLGAWSMVAAVTSPNFADTHHGAVWGVTLIVNVLAFLIPASVIWGLCRKRWPVAGSVVLCVWFVFYIAALFALFPATDGP